MVRPAGRTPSRSEDLADRPRVSVPALCLHRSYNAGMTAITIRDVSDDTVAILKARAAQAGKSLQGYVLDLLSREAAKPTLAEMTARLDRETRTELSLSDVLGAIEDGRERR